MSYDDAIGWMVGEPNNGMAAMFTMMNNARLGVGVQGLGAVKGPISKRWSMPVSAANSVSRSAIIRTCVGC